MRWLEGAAAGGPVCACPEEAAGVGGSCAADGISVGSSMVTAAGGRVRVAASWGGAVAAGGTVGASVGCCAMDVCAGAGGCSAGCASVPLQAASSRVAVRE